MFVKYFLITLRISNAIELNKYDFMTEILFFAVTDDDTLTILVSQRIYFPLLFFHFLHLYFVEYYITLVTGKHRRRCLSYHLVKEQPTLAYF